MNLIDPTGKFCYSLDGERYKGMFDTPGAAAAQAQTYIDDDCEVGEVREYHVAECCHPLDTIMHDKFHLWTGDRIVEQIDEWCGDEVAADDWVLDMSNEDKTALGKLVLDFVRENAGVQYYGVKNNETHNYVVGSNDFNYEIKKHVRERLLSLLAEDEGTTSPSRPGMILTPEAESENLEFFREYGSDGNCSCHLSAPCGSCTHPGNPVNQEETDECWIPVLKGGAQ